MGEDGWTGRRLASMHVSENAAIHDALVVGIELEHKLADIGDLGHLVGVEVEHELSVTYESAE